MKGYREALKISVQVLYLAAHVLNENGVRQPAIDKALLSPGRNRGGLTKD